MFFGVVDICDVVVVDDDDVVVDAVVVLLLYCCCVVVLLLCCALELGMGIRKVIFGSWCFPDEQHKCNDSAGQGVFDRYEVVV